MRQTIVSRTKMSEQISPKRSVFLIAGAAVVALAATSLAWSRQSHKLSAFVEADTLASLPAQSSKADTSRAAFLRAWTVFDSPRCKNCHPAGDAPLQGDDSHVHLQNVRRGSSGHGVTAMRCETCHQTVNLAGAHIPPGNPKWALPPPEQKMVFVGRSPSKLCKQIKDPKQNGGRS